MIFFILWIVLRLSSVIKIEVSLWKATTGDQELFQQLCPCMCVFNWVCLLLYNIERVIPLPNIQQEREKNKIQC